jgi:PPK2 family polyphosphate:nucleotide phosphotransferase
MLKHKDLLIAPGKRVRLDDIDPDFTDGFKDKADAQEKLTADVARLAELQDVLYASRSCAVLLVLQGMDSAGKDGAIKHVMSGVNPAGVGVYSFKAPTDVERQHDFLWRCSNVLPEQGRIAIFNRSYYEEVLVVRVHPELLKNESLGSASKGAALWTQRFEEINAFERHLVRNGTHIVKCFLHISKQEQRKRLLERIDVPTKNWKLSSLDVQERQYWGDYAHAYEDMLSNTSTEAAPWYAIPSNHKWFTRTAIAHILVATLGSLHLEYPTVNEEKRAELKVAKIALEAES